MQRSEMKCTLITGLLFVVFTLLFVRADGPPRCLNTDVIKMYTPDDRIYQYIEIKTNAFRLKVRATNDAHVGLFVTPDSRDMYYEIVLGGWGNTKSVIRKDKRDGQGLQDVVTVLTNYYLSSTDYVDFFIWFSNNTLMVGIEDDPFMVYRDGSTLLDFSYMGVHTGFGATGKWIIQLPNCKNNQPDCSVKRDDRDD